MFETLSAHSLNKFHRHCNKFVNDPDTITGAMMSTDYFVTDSQNLEEIWKQMKESVKDSLITDDFNTLYLRMRQDKYDRDVEMLITLSMDNNKLPVINMTIV